MEFFIGAMGMLLFFILPIGAYILGYRHGSKTVKPKEDTIDEKLSDELKKRELGFQAIMNYDYNIALGKKVNK